MQYRDIETRLPKQPMTLCRILAVAIGPEWGIGNGAKP